MREDRRKSRRFPVLEEQQQATLRVGDVSFSARLIDQSATGFSIRMEEHPGVFPGEVVWLQTVAGWTEVRVVKARHDVEGTQIGFERLADLAIGPLPVGRVLSEQLTQENPHSAWPLVVMIVALISVFVFLIWTGVARHMFGDGFAAKPEASELADRRPAAVRAIEREATRRDLKFQKSIQEYRIGLITLPEVMEVLGLSPAQKKQLQSIVDVAIEQEQALRKTSQGGDDQELESKVKNLREAATELAMRILDEQQQQEWTSMFEAAMERLFPPDQQSDNDSKKQEDQQTER